MVHALAQEWRTPRRGWVTGSVGTGRIRRAGQTGFGALVPVDGAPWSAGEALRAAS